MSYAVKQDLIDRFHAGELIQITNPEDPTAVAINDVVLDGALADAAAEIDGFLMGRYTLPLVTVPTALRRIACDIARYHLYDDRATEQVQKRYDDAVRFLRDVSKGDINLSLSDAAQPTDETGGAAAQGNDRVFSSDTLSDYQ